jgi:large repetitive protein
MIRTQRQKANRLSFATRNRRLFVEQLESRRVMAGVPTASIFAQPTAMIGQSIPIQVAFDNTHASDPGYGPFVDLYVPRNGADGTNGSGTDGLTYVAGSANYLGAPLTTTVLVFPNSGGGTGTVLHPYAKDALGDPIAVTGPAGDQLVVLQLPFGSFTSSQPAATIDLSVQMSNLADLGTPLSLRARAGFQFGNDPLDNTNVDPVLLSSVASASAWPVNRSITPTLLTLTKTYIGPEDETATGPNFPRQYKIDIDVANGQTITAADIIDLLPNNVQLVSVDSFVPATGSVTTTPTTPANAPNNELVVRFPTLTGTAATEDATVVFTYFVPFRNANSTQIIDPNSGNDATALNNARFEGDWNPIDTRDVGGTNNAVANPVGPEHELTPKSIAVQKSVAIVNDVGGAGYSGGDTVEYTINFQISDYFAFEDLAINDILSDGQRFDASFIPTLRVTEHGSTSTGNINAANFVITDRFTGAVAPVAPLNGTQIIDFAISDELVTRSLDGTILGGLIPVGGTGGADPNPINFDGGASTGRITFRAIIQDDFTDDFPSNDASVDEGDTLGNDVSITGTVRRFDNLSAQQTEVDLSGTSSEIVSGTLTKAIYAINGNTTLPSPLILSPGDTITYRIGLTIPSSDIEDLRLDDYLPLPVLQAGQVTSFSDVVSAAIPAAGTAKFGPNDTFRAIYGAAPALSTDPVSNRVSFDYGDFDRDPSVASTIDLLFTVTASSTPFADGLFLTNQVRRSQDSTNAGTFTNDAIVQIVLGQPYLVLSKGIVSTDNPVDIYNPTTIGPVSFTAPGTAGYRGSATIHSTNLETLPIQSNVRNVDAGDIVTFAIVVENTGTSRRGAFDVQLRDTLPAGFAIPTGGLNLNVSDGTGAAMTFTAAGTGLFDAAGGIRINDPGATAAAGDGSDAGALDAYDPTDGRNILIVTYDLQLQSTVLASQTIPNTATLTNYASVEGGADFTTNDLNDAANTTIAAPVVTKTITSTNQASTTGSNVAIGEIVTYQSVITIPEGSTNSLVWTDTPDAGLAIIDITGVTSSSGDVSSSVGTFASILAAATIPASGASASLNFGNLTNINRDDLVGEQITVTYRAVVLNTTANNRTTVLDNQIAATHANGTVNVDGPDVTIVEPLLSVTQSIAPTTGQASEVFTVTIDVAHLPASDHDAFNVALSDVLPAGLVYVGGSLTNVSGLAPTTLSESGGTISASFTSFPDGSTSRIQFQAQASPSVIAGTTLTNAVNQTWTSLPGTVTTAQSGNALSTERTGSTSDPGAAANDHRASDSESVTIISPVLTKILVDTNQAHTTGNTLAIGEIATYRVTIPIPQGSLPNSQFVDTPDLGLSIIDVLSITASTGVVTDVVGSFAAVDSNATIAANGASLTLNFGTLTNSDTNTATPESIVVEYRAVALNSATNNRGTVLDNQGVFTWSTSSSVNFDGPDLTIVEPELDVQTSIIQATGQANELVEVRVVLAHTGASNATAMDVSLTDILPSGLIFDSGLTTLSGLAPTTLSESGGTITANWASLTTAQTSTLRFFARLAPGVQPGQSVTNPASVRWSSLPGSVITAQSTSPISTERTGTTANPGGTSNDHQDSANDSITIINPALSKTIVATNQVHTSGANVAIGEIVTYDLVLTVPQGVLPTSIITDTPDAGLAIVDVVSITGSASVSSSLGALGLITPTIPVGGSSLTVNFGTLTNSDTSTASNETVTIRYRAVILNTLANDAGDVLDNQGGFTWGTTGTLSVDGPDLTLVEPQLSIVVSDGSPTTVDAGDTITFTINVAHTGASTADGFDLNLQNLIDSLPNHLQYVPGSLNVTNAGGAVSGTNTTTGGDLNLNWSTFPLAATSIVSFQALVENTAPAATNLTNPASLRWTSLPTNVTTPLSSNALSVERTGNTGNPGAAANDHAASDNGIVTTRPPVTSKSVLSTNVPGTGVSQLDPVRTDVTIGELVTYNVTVTLPEGTNTLTITDQLPNGPTFLEMVSATVVGVGSRITASAPTITITDTNADSINDRSQWAFGSVLNTPDSVTDTGDVVTVQVVARVLDRPGNTNGVVLSNVATIDVSGSTSVVNADVEIVRPQLQINVVANTLSGPPGSVVPYTITINHAAGSTGPAYDLDLTELLSDPNLDLVPGSIVTSRGTIASGNGSTDTTIRITDAALLLGETITVTFNGRVNPSAAGGLVLPNTSAIAFDSLPGAGGRTDSVSDPASFTTTAPQVDLQITSSISQSPTVINTPLTYTLNVRNNGPSTATLVQVVDTLAAGVTGVSAVPSQGTAGIAGSIMTANLGTLLPGQSATIVLNVVTPSIASTIVNRATVSALQAETLITNNQTELTTVVLAVSSIAGRSWVDVDRDGVVDTGELVLPGVGIVLTGTNDLGQTVNRSTTTNASGNYLFDLLRPGTYQVRQQQPTLFRDGSEYVGSQGGTRKANDVFQVALAAGINATDYLFAELGLRSDTLSKRSLVHSRLRQGPNLTQDDFRSILGSRGQADLDGDGDVDAADFALFGTRLGGQFNL